VTGDLRGLNCDINLEAADSQKEPDPTGLLGIPFPAGLTSIPFTANCIECILLFALVCRPGTAISLQDLVLFFSVRD
jgi:hypothetical protein